MNVDECPCVDWQVWQRFGDEIVDGHHSHCDRQGNRVLPELTIKTLLSWEVETFEDYINTRRIHMYPVEVRQAFHHEVCRRISNLMYEVGVYKSIRRDIYTSLPRPKKITRATLMQDLQSDYVLVPKKRARYIATFLKEGSLDAAAAKCGVKKNAVKTALDKMSWHAATGDD